MAENLKMLKGQAVPQPNSPGRATALAVCWRFSVKHRSSVMGTVFLGKHSFWNLLCAKFCHLCFVSIRIFHAVHEHMFPQILFT